MKISGIVIASGILLALALWVRFRAVMPHDSPRGGALPPLTTEEAALRHRLEAHVSALAGDIGERNLWRYDALRQAASYVKTHFEDLGYTVVPQEYRVEGKAVENLTAEIRGTLLPEEIIVLGAHYDSVAGSPGANDNATGVAALLEAARLLVGREPVRTVRFAAFVNEEPPFFQTASMGSLVYARSARQRKEKIVAAISLETIGCFSDDPGSQNYPPPLGLIYPDRANFIGFVGNLSSALLVRRAIASFRRHASLPSQGIAAPPIVMGVGWSDHWSFWQEGFPAIMVTDTALFRYPHYHAGTDTPEKIDYARTARVVSGMARVILDLAGEGDIPD
jgi:hypothetical protein